MSTVLVVYASTQAPLRSAVADHLYALKRYSGHECVYVNVAVPGAEVILRLVNPDVVVFHTIFLAQRWNRRNMARYERRVAALRTSNALKIAMPQDEFLETDYLCDFISRFGVSHILTVAPPSEWDGIYGRLDPQPSIEQILTGYLDDSTVARLGVLAAESERHIDIGYRANHAEAWLGSWGRLKVEVGRRLADSAASLGLTVDVSTRSSDTLLGDDWMRFLVSCRYVAGVEGGASIHDRDGSLMRTTRSFVRQNPSASYEEVEAACFPGRDGESKLKALSPRHLEAVAARTGQILIEGDFNGVLRAGDHYLALRPDFENLDEILERIKDERLRQRLVTQAYQDVVASGLFSYRTFVREVMEPLIGCGGSEKRLAAIANVVVQIFTVYGRVAIRFRMAMKRLAHAFRIRNAAQSAGIRRISTENG